MRRPRKTKPAAYGARRIVINDRKLGGFPATAYGDYAVFLDPSLRWAIAKPQGPKRQKWRTVATYGPGDAAKQKAHVLAIMLASKQFPLRKLRDFAAAWDMFGPQMDWSV